MRGYTIVWSGQLVSLLGTGMKDFALVIWAWQLTGQATALALVAFFAFVPTVILMPFAGVMVDRYDRKWIMALTDATAGMASFGILVLYYLDSLELWHVYGLVLFAGAFQAFQWPAISAATTMMVPKRDYGRANAMLTTAQAASLVFSPIMAAVLLGVIDISGILAIDVITFLIALACLYAVPIPKPPASAEGAARRGSIWGQMAFGFSYIWERRPLLGLQLVIFVTNLVGTIGFTVLSPMILARTGNDATLLGTVMMVAGVGGVAGGVATAVWGVPHRKVRGLLAGLVVSGLGGIVVGLGRSLPLWAVGGFLYTVTWPLTNACNQAIWQSKVPPDLQGRVFATRGLIATVGTPISQVIAGPMADLALEPALMHATGIAAVLVGSGPGAGMAMMVLVSSILATLVGVVGYAFRSVREVETLLPDHPLAKEDEELEEGTEGSEGEGGSEGEDGYEGNDGNEGIDGSEGKDLPTSDPATGGRQGGG